MSKKKPDWSALKQAANEKKAAARNERLAAVEAARGDAMVALDAWLQAGRPVLGDDNDGAATIDLWIALKIDALEALALTDYKLRHPTARGERGYVFRAESKGARLGAYHCRYCGERLTPGDYMAKVGEWLSEFYAPVSVRAHLVECALRCLSGQVQPAQPGRVLLSDCLPQLVDGELQ